MELDFFASILGARDEFKAPTIDDIEVARDNGFLILSCHSDDLIEIDGLYDDEISAYDGGSAFVDSQGVLPVNPDGTLQSDEPTTVFECKEIADRFVDAISVKAEWDPDQGDSQCKLKWKVTVEGPCNVEYFYARSGDQVSRFAAVQPMRSRFQREPFLILRGYPDGFFSFDMSHDHLKEAIRLAQQNPTDGSSTRALDILSAILKESIEITRKGFGEATNNLLDQALLFLYE